MKSIICDIDGVLLHDNTVIPGAERFINRVLEAGNPLLLLTNYPSQTPSDLQNRLEAGGIQLTPNHFYTSAMATAAFLERQDGRKAFVIGEGALTHELYRIGFTITDINPDFVIVGETHAYNWEMIQKASHFINLGARFVATNPDVAGPKLQPACGALCAPIERITGKKPFYIGKPSAWIMRAALNQLDVHSEDTVIIGDNMNTDILAGIQAGIETILVLTGFSQMKDLDQFPYRPNHIFPAVDDIDIL
ncbi:HAD-IIA family hydrolase [candidate division KSB1 bacterium]|nr:HAD-IIA family hydrolase [candidate division KSB1 bacterium]